MSIHLMAPMGYTGYGQASLNILKSLLETTKVGLSVIGQPNIESQEQASLVRSAIDNTIDIPRDSPCVKIWHQFDLLTRAGTGKYYGFPFFEVDSFNSKEIYHLNSTDEIIVSSEWAKNVMLSNNIDKPIHIVPLGVDLDVFNAAENQKRTDHSKYIFFTIGKWEKRKAHDTIIECFNSAFSPEDNVELWLVTHNPFLNPQQEQSWTQLARQSKLSNKIKIFPRLSTHKMVAELISNADCGIYISRGEGWNMELLETMAMDKPVIASNFSAHTEYCTDKNSFLVNITETEPAIDDQWFFGTSNWGKIDKDQMDQTIEHMKYCYNNRISTNEAGLETAKELNWKNTANKLLSLI